MFILILEIMNVEGYYYCITFTSLISVHYHCVHHDANDSSGKKVGKVKHGQLFGSDFPSVSRRFMLISESLTRDVLSDNKGSVYLMTASMKEIFWQVCVGSKCLVSF